MSCGSGLPWGAGNLPSRVWGVTELLQGHSYTWGAAAASTQTSQIPPCHHNPAGLRLSLLGGHPEQLCTHPFPSWAAQKAPHNSFRDNFLVSRGCGIGAGLQPGEGEGDRTGWVGGMGWDGTAALSRVQSGAGRGKRSV